VKIGSYVIPFARESFPRGRSCGNLWSSQNLIRLASSSEISSPVRLVEFGVTGRLMRRYLLSMFERAAILQIGGNSGLIGHKLNGAACNDALQIRDRGYVPE